jgi:hypothetical protein
MPFPYHQYSGGLYKHPMQVIFYNNPIVIV